MALQTVTLTSTVPSSLWTVPSSCFLVNAFLVGGGGGGGSGNGTTNGGGGGGGGRVRYVMGLPVTPGGTVTYTVGSAGAASSKIILRYQATSGSPFTASSYSDIGTSEVSVAVNVANNILVSSWINMASGAKDDVWVTILGIDGDGTINPQFGNIYAEFRFV